MAEVEEVEVAEELVRGKREFEDKGAATGLKDAVHLFEALGDVDDVADAEGDGGGVELR